jgi:redox-sensitive bicupin YhaK (pirin superfamily)
VALPDGHEDVAPEFTHYPAKVLPQRARGGVELAVIAGAAFGMVSPVVTRWPTLYVHANFEPGTILKMPPEHAERAVYVVQGELVVGDTKIVEGQLVVLQPESEPTLKAMSATRAMVLGGAAFPTPRFIWWNFVASSLERIELAKDRWAKRQFAPVPGDDEFIPLPPR